MTPSELRALASRVETEKPTDELRAAVLTAFGSEAEPGCDGAGVVPSITGDMRPCSICATEAFDSWCRAHRPDIANR